MKKQLLLSAISAMCFFSIASAQITVQRADFQLSTTAKDSLTSKLLKKTGATLPTGGNNQTWDYSSLKDSVSSTYYTGGIFEPAKTPRPTAFATATSQYPYVNYFQNFGLPNNTYFRTDATSFSMLGDSIFKIGYSLQAISGSASDSLKFAGQTRAMVPAWSWYVFPVTANSVWKNNFKVTTNFSLSVGLFGLNDAPGQVVNNQAVVDTVMGWGTLKLRHPSTGATLSFNTLLARQTYAIVDSFFLGGAPAPAALLGAFGLTQGNRTTSTRYYYLGATFKAPYLSLELNTAGAIGNIFRGILPDLGLTVKNNEITNLEVKTTVFPNPTTEGVTFEFDKQSADDWRVFVYNAAGQIIKNEAVKAPIGLTQHKTSFERSLPSGVYFYQILDDNSLIRNSGKVMVNH